MPVLIDISSPDHHLFAAGERNRVKLSFKSAEELSRHALNIGLINNMPDSALTSTERQLFDLLDAAAGMTPVHLRLYTLPAVPRADWGQRYTRRFYTDVGDLWDGDLDGLIVTGAEPLTPQLTAEPYWRLLEQVIDWAQENTISTIWSCLAVHGAVLHVDGIDRHRLVSKRIGVFHQMKMREHSLVEGLPSRLEIPHSRWNEVHEDALVARGYDVLTKSVEAGVDMFSKQQKNSLFVFFQGHPEYDAYSLLGEYRRDVGRFLRGEAESYPTMPRRYFDDEATELLVAFQRRALADRRRELFASFPADRIARSVKNTWQLAAKRIYRNWIRVMLERKSQEAKLAVPSAANGATVHH